MGKRKRSRIAHIPTAGTEAAAEGPVTRVVTTRNLVVLSILAATFISFASALGNDFAYDDRTQILQNEFIRSISNVPKALVTEAWFWRQQQDKDPNRDNKATTPYYRPVFTIYLMLGWQIFEESAGAWHFANVLMHLIAVFLVFLVIEKVTGEMRLAALSGLILAIHPLRSETVAWISGLTDLILAILLLSSFYLYMTLREKGAYKYLLGSLGLYLL